MEAFTLRALERIIVVIIGRLAGVYSGCCTSSGAIHPHSATSANKDGYAP